MKGTAVFTDTGFWTYSWAHAVIPNNTMMFSRFTESFNVRWWNPEKFFAILLRNIILKLLNYLPTVFHSVVNPTLTSERLSLYFNQSWVWPIASYLKILILFLPCVFSEALHNFSRFYLPLTQFFEMCCGHQIKFAGIKLRYLFIVWKERSEAAFSEQSSLPFMVDTEAGQPSDGVSLYQLLQADCTFSCILSEDILCKMTHRQE